MGVNCSKICPKWVQFRLPPETLETRTNCTNSESCFHSFSLQFFKKKKKGKKNKYIKTPTETEKKPTWQQSPGETDPTTGISLELDYYFSHRATCRFGQKKSGQEGNERQLKNKENKFNTWKENRQNGFQKIKYNTIHYTTLHYSTLHYSHHSIICKQTK